MQSTGSGKMKEDEKILIYSGHPQEHILEVRMYLISPVTKALIGWKRFQTRNAKVTIIQADVPAMEADDNKKDNFYKILEHVIDEIRRHDIKPWMGDFDT